MERLAMDVAGSYSVTSSGNPYCLIVEGHFSKWLEYFLIPNQKVTTISKKLVYEVLAWYKLFRELHNDQDTKFLSQVLVDIC